MVKEKERFTPSVNKASARTLWDGFIRKHRTSGLFLPKLYFLGGSPPHLACVSTLAPMNSNTHFALSEKEMAIQPSVVAWRFPWMEESGELKSTGSERAGRDRASFALYMSLTHNGSLTNISWMCDEVHRIQNSTPNGGMNRSWGSQETFGT